MLPYFLVNGELYQWTEQMFLESHLLLNVNIQCYVYPISFEHLKKMVTFLLSMQIAVISACDIGLLRAFEITEICVARG